MGALQPRCVYVSVCTYREIPLHICASARSGCVRGSGDMKTDTHTHTHRYIYIYMEAGKAIDACVDMCICACIPESPLLHMSLLQSISVHSLQKQSGAVGAVDVICKLTKPSPRAFGIEIGALQITV